MRVAENEIVDQILSLYESCEGSKVQVAKYEEGERFGEHDDGFPYPTALQSKFQRRATVLVYLNDVATGGHTHFTHLDVSVTPKRGRAVVFFPAFNDNRPDDRLLHEAEAAGDVKWVAQQWCAVGVAPRQSGGAAPAAAPAPVPMNDTTMAALRQMQAGKGGFSRGSGLGGTLLGAPKGKRAAGRGEVPGKKGAVAEMMAGGTAKGAGSDSEPSARDLIARKRRGKAQGKKNKGFS